MHLIMLIFKSQLIHHQQHVRHSLFCAMSSSDVLKTITRSNNNESFKKASATVHVNIPIQIESLIATQRCRGPKYIHTHYGGLAIVPSRPICRPRLFWRWQLTSMVCRRWWWRLGQNNRLQLWTTTTTIMLSFPPPNEIRSSTCYLTDVAPALFLVGGGHCFFVGGVDVSVL